MWVAKIQHTNSKKRKQIQYDMSFYHIDQNQIDEEHIWMKWTRSTHSRCHFGIPVLCCGLCRGSQRWKRPKNANGMCHTHTDYGAVPVLPDKHTHTHTPWHKHTLWCSASDIQTNNCALLVSHRQTIVPYQCHTDKSWCHGVKNKQIRQIFWMWQNLPEKKNKVTWKK